MQLRQRHQFTTIRTEGSILPADLLQRINEREAGLAGLKPDDYHLPGNLKLNEAINQSWNRLLGAWTAFRPALVKLPDTVATTLTREKWLLPVFNELGYGRLLTARAIELDSRSYPVSHGWQHTPLHLVGAGVDLDKRTAGVAGAARMSPHGLVQELLNRSEAHLWGMVSNGLRLRILRDNVSLTRQAYVEFDLEAMMNGELYADFALFWLLCHESRVHAEKPQDCWLEKWSKAAQDQGTRALEQLRRGVEEAIEVLGRGFLAHASNHALVACLRTGTLSTQDYYRQLLRLVYRLLFLFVAEDRDLLLRPDADAQARERYERFYSLSRLRLLAKKRVGTRHADLYHGLRLVMAELSSDAGCPELGLPALGSFLFSREASPDLEALRLKVCDPACGSGHFLIAAAHRLAKHLASVRTGDDEPAPEAVRTALRDVIGHCIYGVDINPMAVELCKVSLWMEALEPGKPLSFLDHRIQCGNSLIGATPALLKDGIPDDAFKPIEGDDRAVCSEYRKHNKQEREGQQLLFAHAPEPWARLGNLATGLLQLEEISDDSIAGVRRKQERWEQLVRSQGYIYSRLWADAWCAAFVWKKIRDHSHPYPITEELFRKIERNPFHIVNTSHETEIRRLAEQYQLFHWHLAFPDVFRVPIGNEEPENEQTEWRGGFDVVLGNPPWEKMQTEEVQFFAARAPEIAKLKGAKRKAAIKALQQTDPALAMLWKEQKRHDAAKTSFIRNSGVYPLTGVGKFNSFALFAELNNRVMSTMGRVGCIVPSGIATDDTTKLFFQKVTRTNSLASLFDFENRAKLFPEVDSRMKFCLLTLTGSVRAAQSGAEFVFFAHIVEDLNDESHHFILSADEIALLNPNTLTCPIFRSQRDAEITRGIYQRVPIFLNENKPELNVYQPQVWRLINTTDDSADFVRFGHEPSGKLIPVIEAKSIHQFDHRFATFPEDGNEETDFIEVPYELKANPDFEVHAQHYVSELFFRERLPKEFHAKRWFLTARNVTNATNERTVISAIIPRSASCQDTPYIEVAGGALTSAFLVGVLNSFVLDYVARQKVGGTHLSYFVLYQFPILFPPTNHPLTLPFVVPRVLELTYTAYLLRGFAEDCGYTGESFHWDEERRFLLRCELDAAFFHLYGIGRYDVDYILETFASIGRKDEQAHGEYRTKRVILDIYDAMQQAIETGTPYHTRLDPLPAHGWTPPKITLEAATAQQGNKVREDETNVSADLQRRAASTLSQSAFHFDDPD